MLLVQGPARWEASVRRGGSRPDLLLRPAGTFITEWKEGAQLCEAFLAGDDRSFQAVADRLVLLAQFLHFDGWLINIENTLSVSGLSGVASRPSPCYLGVSLRRVLPSPCPHPGRLPGSP